ncbi:MAG: hypothetical protein FWE15_05260, partial [Actinomycetia bacterium]|nr:hypothetical protein [Actinomycetes bacterium]
MSSDRDENRVGGPAPVEDTSESDYTGEFSLGPRLPAWYMQDSAGSSGDASDESEAEDEPADEPQRTGPQAAAQEDRGAAGGTPSPVAGIASVSPVSWSASSVPLIPQPAPRPEPEDDPEPARVEDEPSWPASSAPVVPQPKSPEPGGSQSSHAADEPPSRPAPAPDAASWSVSSVPLIPQPASAEPEPEPEPERERDADSAGGRGFPRPVAAADWDSVSNSAGSDRSSADSGADSPFGQGASPSDEPRDRPLPDATLRFSAAAMRREIEERAGEKLPEPSEIAQDAAEPERPADADRTATAAKADR